MLPQPKPDTYREQHNDFLLRAVDRNARRILDVGCASGYLGEALKAGRPDRYVAGVEIDPVAAANAAKRLDDVFVLDIEHTVPDLPAQSFDCITFGDVLEHLSNPEDALRRYARLLHPDGTVLVSVPNVQHHSVLRGLLRGDFMYQPDGLLDGSHLRFFTHMSFMKLMLDAGFVPEIVDRIRSGTGDPFVHAATPVLQFAGVHPDAALEPLDTYQYIFRGRPRPTKPDGFADTPLTFVVCVNDDEMLESNLARSPCLDPGTPHELIVVRGADSAADGYHPALARARHEIVVFVHQDAYLPSGWDSELVTQWNDACTTFGGVGVAGTYGFRVTDGGSTPVGRVIDRTSLLDFGPRGPVRVDGLDEVVLVVPRTTELRFDPRLGFHLYGTDVAIEAARRDLPVVVLDVPCLHNSLFYALDNAFHVARVELLAKWPDVRPLHATMGRLDTMTAAPVPPTWFDEMRSLAEAAPTLEAEVAALRAALDDRERHIANMEASVFWRARATVNRWLRRG